MKKLAFCCLNHLTENIQYNIYQNIQFDIQEAFHILKMRMEELTKGRRACHPARSRRKELVSGWSEQEYKIRWYEKTS